MYTIPARGGTATKLIDHIRIEHPSFVDLPDGRRAILHQSVDQGVSGHGIYIYGIKTRLTADAAIEGLGAWTPAGDALTYFSNERGNADIFSKSPAGTGAAIALVATPAPEIEPDWSPDGRVLLYMTISRDMKADLWYRERRNDSGLGDPKVFLQTPFAEGQGRFSPDGSFVAYVSDESGRAEIYVRVFPQGSRKWQISGEGGTLPHQPPLSIHVAHNWFEDFRGVQGK